MISNESSLVARIPLHKKTFLFHKYFILLYLKQKLKIKFHVIFCDMMNWILQKLSFRFKRFDLFRIWNLFSGTLWFLKCSKKHEIKKRMDEIPLHVFCAKNSIFNQLIRVFELNRTEWYVQLHAFYWVLSYNFMWVFMKT